MASQVHKGQVHKGRVTNITSYGAFIELGGVVDGLLHVNNFSWGWETISDTLKLGDEIEVKILDFDMDKRKVMLGRKQLFPNPWEIINGVVKAGERVKGIIAEVKKYGLLVKVEPGVIGIIHISEIAWKTENQVITDSFKIGSEIEAMVLSIEEKERKLVLSLKALEFNI